MGTDLVFSDYVRGVRCSAQSAAVLNARLHKSAPDDLTAAEKRALKLVGERCVEVTDVQSTRDRFSQTKLRPVLAVFVNGFNAVHDGLVVVGRVPSDVSDRGERAQALRTSLFPDGLAFLTSDAESAWAEGSRRVERIKAEGMRTELEELVGKDVVETMLKGTQKLADAIGTGRARPVPSTTALQEALLRFSRAVSAYARVMAAAVDEEDPASVERFLEAMAPIDLHRASMARSGGNDDDTLTDEPTVVDPVVPTPTTLNGTPSPVSTPRPTTLNGAPSPTTLNGTPAPTPAEPGTPNAA